MERFHSRLVVQGVAPYLRPPEAAAFDAKYIVRDQAFITQVIRSTLTTTKTKVKDADAPKEWTDVFDPKWKGRIGMDPPWCSVAIHQMLACWEQIGIKD